MAYLDDVPKYGFGTAFDIGEGEGKITEENFKDLLKRAIELGCRHIDCAPLYGTQHLVGLALKEMKRNIPRADFFITSKLPVNMMRTEHIEKSLKSTLAELQISYLDLLLIHAPFSTKYIADNLIYPVDGEGNLQLDDEDGLLESTWKRMVDLKRKGFIKYIGLSNVNLEQLERLNKIHQVDIVQNEFHLYHQDREFFDYCDEIDVHYEAYAAFGSPIRARQDNRPIFMNDPVVIRIAQENNLTPAQVMINWLHQQPLSYIIKTDNLNQLYENLKATHNMILSINDLIDLDSLNKNARLYIYDNYKGITRHREYPFKKLLDIQKEPLGELKKSFN